MPSYRTARTEDYDVFLNILHDQAADYLEPTLRLMQMTWEEFAHQFRTIGQVYSIYWSGQLAGFYWIEERDDVLHLHGLILKSEFQGQGIGTQVLTMLSTKYRDRFTAIELGVYRSNVRAIALYERMGYETVRSLENLGFFVMQKRLQKG
jgi:ribosomal protein S18 acetylase RimI-like enzyme